MDEFEMFLIMLSQGLNLIEIKQLAEIVHG